MPLSRFLLSTAGVLLTAGWVGGAHAAEQFTCGDPAEGFSVAITIDRDKSIGDFSGLGRSGLVMPNGQGGWSNPEAALEFYPDRMPPTLILGSEEFPCAPGAVPPQQPTDGAMMPMPPGGTMGQAPDAGLPPETGQPGALEEATPVNLPGRSLGGNLRRGPGTGFEDIGSLPEGMPLIIYANTHVAFNGYDWFRVVLSDGRVGYQWGGILCSEDKQIPGILQACGVPPVE